MKTTSTTFAFCFFLLLPAAHLCSLSWSGAEESMPFSETFENPEALEDWTPGQSAPGNFEIVDRKVQLISPGGPGIYIARTEFRFANTIVEAVVNQDTWTDRGLGMAIRAKSGSSGYYVQLRKGSMAIWLAPATILTAQMPVDFDFDSGEPLRLVVRAIGSVLTANAYTLDGRMVGEVTTEHTQHDEGGFGFLAFSSGEKACFDDLKVYHPENPPEGHLPGIPFDVTVESLNSEHGTVSGGGGSYLQGSTIALVAEPRDGYVFDHWEGDRIADPSASETTLTVLGVGSAKAVFAPATMKNEPVVDNFDDGELTHWIFETFGNDSTFTTENGEAKLTLATDGFGMSMRREDSVFDDFVVEAVVRQKSWSERGLGIAGRGANSIRGTFVQLSTDGLRIWIHLGPEEEARPLTEAAPVDIDFTKGEPLRLVYRGVGDTLTGQVFTMAGRLASEVSVDDHNLTEGFTGVQSFIPEIAAVFDNFKAYHPDNKPDGALPERYALTVEPSSIEGGSVAGAGTFLEGSEATIKAIPADGYRFVRWEGEGVADSTTSETEVTVSNSLEVVAIFEKAPPVSNAPLRIHLQRASDQSLSLHIQGMSPDVSVQLDGSTDLQTWQSLGTFDTSVIRLESLGHSLFWRIHQ